ncbi:MAG: sigma factor-like helix-turn-helix DNA-binding protein [Bacteroidia bacterium]
MLAAKKCYRKKRSGVFSEFLPPIDRLNEDQKKCIELFYLREMSYKDISELTGFSLNQVKSFIQNGKRNLKLILTNKK